MRRVLSSLCVVLAIIALVSCAPAPAPAVTTPAPALPAPSPTAPPPRVTEKATPAPVTPGPKPAAPKEAPYYQGKTIEIVVQSAAGGGTDTVARIAAALLPGHIPGNPKIVVRNSPAAGGIAPNNIFFSRTKPDGLSLIQNSSSPYSMQLKQPEMVKFDLTKYRHISSVSRASNVLIVRKGLEGRLKDPGGKALVVGSEAGQADRDSMPIWGREFLGWNVRFVLGFGGTGEIELAFMRGEIDIFATSNAFMIRRVTQEGLGEPIATTGIRKSGKFMRRPDFPGIPTFEEALGDKKPSGLPWQSYLAWIGPGVVDKALAAPPGTPDNIVTILVQAFDKMAQSREFDEIMKKMVTDVYSVPVGNDVDSLVKDVLDVPREVLDYAKELQKKVGIGS
ncbi:MAG: hypothetical protein HY673_08545 [Chloroflexi bacterium]|nr:hypothetical protein [Chloroflexota bacterium]